MGLSGYFSGQVGLDEIVDTINTHSTSLNLFRFSFTPNWKTQTHPYNATAIQYILDNTAAIVVVDRTHLYPPTEASALDARNHWDSGVVAGAYEVLAAWPNNSRVYVEIINEYVSSDFDTRMQNIITDIRADGYNNSLVADRQWPFSWTVWYDPENNTYQGFHQYMNERPLATAISRMQTARDAGIQKILNTETGAHFNEFGSFTQALVDSLEEFYDWCYALDAPIFNCLWMREDIENWPTYDALTLDLPTEPPPPVEPPVTLPPYLLSTMISTNLQYQTATFQASWNASEGLAMGWLSHNKTGAWENVTQALEGLEDSFSQTIVLPEAGFVFGYCFGANDTLGNTTTSDISAFTVTSPYSDVPYNAPSVRFPSGHAVSIAADHAVFFGTVKITTVSTAMHITVFLEDNWFNYTVDQIGTQTFYNGTKPDLVLIDGNQRTETNGWTSASSAITVTDAHSSCSLQWMSSTPIRPTDPESPGGPQTSNSLKVLFKTVMGKNPAPQVEITVYEAAYNTYQDRYITDDNGEYLAYLPAGSYNWAANYRGTKLTGSFFHVEPQTVTIDFASRQSLIAPSLDRTQILKIVIAAVVVLAAILVMVTITKKSRFR